ncbi:uncharacterized protein CLUP02_01200 [Colletotrichum lupini]|uniref:Uncharacterized protein n=1 Tax=Colletotrichum lupini TaxID=145971 RepID=A0A9Q8SC81_9PEZI|nr:uncharacterized protein CLUP02_01200 [Colletotrichum lupini]UQC74549.1 hypothetical protein CLUP02_01200 [Colletotrichum lupini]
MKHIIYAMSKNNAWPKSRQIGFPEWRSQGTLDKRGAPELHEHLR